MRIFILNLLFSSTTTRTRDGVLRSSSTVQRRVPTSSPATSGATPRSARPETAASTATPGQSSSSIQKFTSQPNATTSKTQATVQGGLSVLSPTLNVSWKTTFFSLVKYFFSAVTGALQEARFGALAGRFSGFSSSKGRDREKGLVGRNGRDYCLLASSLIPTYSSYSKRSISFPMK